jgi:hypothetical protein
MAAMEDYGVVQLRNVSGHPGRRTGGVFNAFLTPFAGDESVDMGANER